ncbi:hypothetical protein [Paracoccus tegillarcae]|uniref:Uncharacterized protein n=1 Tax=Paracoccus tegillarcae TaxID=1529068 RepID=A0A2K9EJN9_9RHOB|nr:hypothetical protein [Paracoccus tegillarcae]AUH33597.1 hypothetical protein CUV01_09545 [Paracoccus tegillarcae]
MRDLGTPVDLKGSRKRDSLLVITTARDYTADELIRDNIIRELPEAFLRLLSAATGLERAFSIEASAKNQISIRLSADLMTGQWQFASLLNLIDSSTFVGRMDDDPFITTIEIQSHLVAGASLAGLYEDLEKTNAIARDVMTELLAPDFDLSAGLGRVWPQVPSDYFFDVDMAPLKPLDTKNREFAEAMLLDFDRSLAGSAFEPEVSPEAWFEDSLVPYGVEIHADQNLIKYRVDFPPSDISTGLLLVRQALEARFIQIKSWSFDIREGW